MARIGIIGAGSWGIALAALLHKNGHEVTVWSVLESEVEQLRTKREYPDRLPGVKLPEDMLFTTDLQEAVEDKDALVMAVPSRFTRETARKMKPYVAEGQIVVNVSKGVEESTLMTLSQVIEQELPQARTAVLCGPSHAEEVSRGLPTTIVAGARKKAVAEYIQNLFMKMGMLSSIT